ncbi:MAG: plastocyanin/azurin family copper-binding protein [Dehalococcoidia bacterium]
MLRSIRIEASVLAALTISILALVLAMRAGGSYSVSLAQEGGNGQPVSVLDAAPDGAREVDIYNFAYDPDPIRVSAGQAVAWTNLDEAPHTVTADDASWGSGRLDRDQAVVLSFDEPGVYSYICALHPPLLSLPAGSADGSTFLGGGGGGMRGTIIVE